MLRFEVHDIYLKEKRRHYLPLPKLSEAQLAYLADHLEERGFKVARGDRIRASGSTRIIIDRIGLASSSEELLDAIAPAIPQLLRFKKQPTSSNPYFDAKKVKGSFAVRLTTRMESSSLWTALRASGQCGLTPDEALVLQELLQTVEGEIECVTDYPTEGCSQFGVGHYVYYQSSISTAEFAANLRTLTSSSRKNCYLPKQASLMVHSTSLVWRGLPELGEWCFLELPKTSKS